jgi:hypothetical protein
VKIDFLSLWSFKDKELKFFKGYRSIGKKNKQFYNRILRNGKNKLRELKGNEWKKFDFADKWNWD